jgi:Flp pilus assembly protein TadG
MTKSRPPKRMAGEEGSVLITGLLLSIALLMVIGFAVDVGHAFLVKRQLASIADDAALTGSQAIDLPALHEGHLQLEPSQARSEALRALYANPSITAQATATNGEVTVTVHRRVHAILLGIIGMSTITITAHATAAPRGP